MIDNRKDEILVAYKTLGNVNKVAEQFKVSGGTIYKKLQKYFPGTVSPRNKADKIPFQDIIDTYKSGKYKIEDVAKKFNLSATTVYTVLRSHKIVSNKKDKTEMSFERKEFVKKFPFNENYFDDIDTPTKAYLLGFLYADGNNSSKGNTVSLRIHKKDIELIYKMVEEISITSKLFYGKTDNQVQVNLYGKKICEALSKHGCVPRKTFLLEFPKHLEKKFYNHFIRGYFDGDGCFSVKQRAFSLLGTESFLNKVQEILVENCQLNFTKISKRQNIFTLAYGGTIQTKRIRDYLYKDSTFHLSRKYSKFYSI